ncbi:sarcoma antigen ny-sar-95-related [Anaeramoeba ignava]|uniref:Sarcoma antigen ny-sar-95-related n=1 Tax=Anaeramoeba ignava TaxID=1746090 RepID=A0A9Q0R5U9_ANAIG|nr:sarcoma antigen ny-sar-95-related [Anaeramoeba ignava]
MFPKTAILLKYSTPNFEKPTFSISPLTTIKKSNKTIFTESILEYARLSFQILKEQSTLSLFLYNSEIKQLNSFQTKDQNLDTIINNLSEFSKQNTNNKETKKQTLSSKPHLIKVWRKVLQSITTENQEYEGKTKSSFHQKSHRIICLVSQKENEIFSDQFLIDIISKQNIRSIKNRQLSWDQKMMNQSQFDSETISQNYQLITTCEIVLGVIDTSSLNEDQNTSQKTQNQISLLERKFYQKGFHLQIKRYKIPILKLNDFMKDLAQYHFHLSSLRVIDIPMKDKNQTEKVNQVKHEVIFLFQNKKKVHKEDEKDWIPGNFEYFNRYQKTWSWNCGVQPLSRLFSSKLVYAAAPFTLSDSPTKCLLKYVSEGKIVILSHQQNEEQKKGNNKQIILLSHKNQVYIIHTTKPRPSSLENAADLPPTALIPNQFYPETPQSNKKRRHFSSNKIEIYTLLFELIVKQTMIKHQKYEVSLQKNQHLTTPEMERITRLISHKRYHKFLSNTIDNHLTESIFSIIKCVGAMNPPQDLIEESISKLSRIYENLDKISGYRDVWEGIRKYFKLMKDEENQLIQSFYNLDELSKKNANNNLNQNQNQNQNSNSKSNSN